MKKQEAQTEVGRELDMRKRNYPKWVQSGSLNKDQAKRQMDRMATVWCILDTMTETEFADLIKRYEKGSSTVQQLSLL